MENCQMDVEQVEMGRTPPPDGEEPTVMVQQAAVADIHTVSSDDSLSVVVPPKETPELNLGKGKRARIPNKRYSDIALSPHFRLPQSPKTSTAATGGGPLENGDFDSPTNTAMTVVCSPATSANVKKTKLVDITNPCYKLPFQYGWRRELVFRAIYDANNQRIPGDVYYYTPNNKKIRSIRELSEILRHQHHDHLTLDNFTFAKEAIGVNDPNKEILRDAKTAQKRPSFPSPATAFKSHPSTVASDHLKVKTPSKQPNQYTSKAAKSYSKSPLGNTPPIKKFRVNEENLESSASRRNKVLASKSSGTIVARFPNVVRRRPLSSSPRQMPNAVQNHRGGGGGVSTTPITTVTSGTNLFTQNYLQTLAYGYKTLLHIFQYLKVQDLLRASCVCHMWHDIATHTSLWRTVRLKNSQVYNFDGLANSLRRHGTIDLDLRKMLLSNDDIWPDFLRHIHQVDSLRRVDLCRCPAHVVQTLATTNPTLEVLNAVTIRCEQLDLSTISKLKNLRELRLKSTSGVQLVGGCGLSALGHLNQLRHLSLTSVRDLYKASDLEALGKLRTLQVLDLGECSNLPASFAVDVLPNLVSLERLRLEKGQEQCHTFEILAAVRQMAALEQLELINFDIKPGFDVALGECTNLKRLLLIPTYISQSATTNHMVLGGVARLKATLQYFVWGVTLELLRVTELFVDQVEPPPPLDGATVKSGGSNRREKRSASTGGGNNAAITGDSIPVLKPVPLVNRKAGAGAAATSATMPAVQEQQQQKSPPGSTDEPPQVEILPLPNLHKLLVNNLPTTRVKILKIPFHATWRQTITDATVV